MGRQTRGFYWPGVGTLRLLSSVSLDWLRIRIRHGSALFWEAGSMTEQDRIRFRMKVKSRIRIRIQVKSWIRIRIREMRILNPGCCVSRSSLLILLHPAYPCTFGSNTRYGSISFLWYELKTIQFNFLISSKNFGGKKYYLSDLEINIIPDSKEHIAAR